MKMHIFFLNLIKKKSAKIYTIEIINHFKNLDKRESPLSTHQEIDSPLLSSIKVVLSSIKVEYVVPKSGQGQIISDRFLSNMGGLYTIREDKYPSLGQSNSGSLYQF